MLDLDQLLAYAVERGASDVHLKVGSPPFIRIDGRLERIDHAQVTPVETERIAFAIMPKLRAEEFIASSDADFAYSVSGVGRFRVNVMRQRGSVGLVLRRVQIDIPSFEALGLPPVVRKLAEHERGLVLVTGPTGSGKTTTLGSMIDYTTRPSTSTSSRSRIRSRSSIPTRSRSSTSVRSAPTRATSTAR